MSIRESYVFQNLILSSKSISVIPLACVQKSAGITNSLLTLIWLYIFAAFQQAQEVDCMHNLLYNFRYISVTYLQITIV